MILLITYDIKKIIFIKKISNSLESARKVCLEHLVHNEIEMIGYMVKRVEGWG
jgi:hypothetical protein